jgi:phosphatidylglycerol:prolipoprotein diacylglycerol transferase
MSEITANRIGGLFGFFGLAACRRDILAELGNLFALSLHEFAQRIEVFTLDQVHIGDEALDLCLDDGLGLATDAIGNAGDIVHQAANIIKYFAGLGHSRILRPDGAPNCALGLYVGNSERLDQRRTPVAWSASTNWSCALPFPNIDPVAFAIGPFAVRWYALAYLGGVLLGALYGMSLLKRKTLWFKGQPPFEPAAIFDFAFWAVLGIIVGGRLGYVLFYNPAYYAANPLEAFKLWDGGMSFHGGLVGIIVAMALFTRSKGGNILSSLDLLGCVGTIGLFLGRIANFINGELWGRETTLPWGVIFPGAGDLPRHPSQLYEAALEGILLFLVIRFITHVAYGLRRPGLVAGVFGIGYALARILVEQVRVPDAQLGYFAGEWLTMGVILSLPILLIGLGLVIYAMRKPRGL